MLCLSGRFLSNCRYEGPKESQQQGGSDTSSFKNQGESSLLKVKKPSVSKPSKTKETLDKQLKVKSNEQPTKEERP